MPQHTTPANLPRDNETKEQFLNRSGKTIMQKTGKSKHEAQIISEGVWDRHVQQNISFNANVSSGIRWVSNTPGKLTPGSAAPPPLMNSQQGPAGAATVGSSMPQMIGNAGAAPGRVGAASSMDTNMQSLLKGQREQTSVLIGIRSSIQEAVEELTTIRTKGHKIRKLDDRRPQTTDFWNPDRGNITLSKIGMTKDQLDPTTGKIMEGIDFLLNPVKRTKRFAERKTKGFLSKAQELLEGPQASNFRKDPGALLEAAGVRKLDSSDLKQKVITKTFPLKLDEITSLQREQLDVLRNIYRANKDVAEATTGRDLDYVKSEDTSMKVFDTATGEYMSKDVFDKEMSNREKKVARAWEKAKRGGLNNMLSGGVNWLTGGDFDLLESTKKAQRKIFKSTAELEDDDLVSNTVKSSVDDIGAKYDVEDFIKRRASLDEKRDKAYGDFELFGPNASSLSDVFSKAHWGKLASPAEMFQDYMNAGTQFTTGKMPNQPQHPEFNASQMMGNFGWDGNGEELSFDDKVQHFKNRTASKLAYAKDAIFGFNDTNDPRTIALTRRNKDLSGQTSPAISDSTAWLGTPRSLNFDDIKPQNNVVIDGITKETLTKLNEDGGLSVAVISPDIFKVITSGDLPTPQTKDPENQTSADLADIAHSLKKTKWQHTGSANTISGPPHMDNVVVRQRGELVIPKGKSQDIHKSSADTAFQTEKLVDIESEQVKLTRRIANGIESLQVNNAGGVADTDPTRRTVGEEMREIEVQKQHAATTADRKEADKDRDSMIEQLKGIKSKFNKSKSDAKSGFSLSKLMGGVLPVLGTIASGIGTVVGLLGTAGPIVAGLTALYALTNETGRDTLRGLGGIAAAMAESDKMRQASRAADAASDVGRAADAANDLRNASRPNMLSRAMSTVRNIGRSAINLGQRGLQAASNLGSRAVNATIDAGRSIYNAGARAVNWTIDTAKGVYNALKAKAMAAIEKLAAPIRKLKTAYDTFKKASTASALARAFEPIKNFFVKYLIPFFQKGWVQSLCKWLGALALMSQLWELYNSLNNGTNTVSIAIQVVEILCTIITIPAIATVVTGGSAGAGIILVAVCAGLGILLPKVREWIEGGGAEDATNEGISDAMSGPDIQTAENSATNITSVSDDEIASSLPEESSSLVDNPSDMSGQGSTPPQMHSGGIVRPHSFDNAFTNSGFVDSIGCDNVTRTLQRGEYVMTKGETQSLTISLGKLVNTNENQYAKLINIDTSIARIQEILEEFEEARKKAESTSRGLGAISGRATGEASGPISRMGSAIASGVRSVASGAYNLGRRAYNAVAGTPTPRPRVTFEDTGGTPTRPPNTGATPANQTTHPLPGGVVTSHFGPRGGRQHKGVDLGISGNPNGVAPVVAHKEGKVMIASSLRGYGNVVYLNHEDGTQTRYAHLANFNVQQGDEVQAGQELGKMGNTGIGTGPHLHFELRKGLQLDNSGTPTDPERAINSRGQIPRNDVELAEANEFNENERQPRRQASQVASADMSNVASSGDVKQAYHNYRNVMKNGSAEQKSKAEDAMRAAGLSTARADVAYHTLKTASSGGMDSTNAMVASMTKHGESRAEITYPSRLRDLPKRAQAVSNTNTARSLNKDMRPDPPTPPIVMPPTQVPLPINVNGQAPSMAHKQSRTVDHVTEMLIDKIFANTLVSFMNGITDFGLGNKATTVFKNSASA